MQNYKKSLNVFVYSVLRKLKSYLVVTIFSVSYYIFKLINKKPDAIITFGKSLGDDLLCTIVACQLKEKGYKRVWMKTFYPEIFINNPFIHKVIENKEPYLLKSKIIDKYLRVVKPQIIKPIYTKFNAETDGDEIPSKHIVHIMCDIANVCYPQSLKPSIYLSTQEIEKGKLFDNQICIQSTGIGSENYMSNKDWIKENFTDVVFKLKNRYSVIQIGSKNDYLIPGTIDLRAKTSIRESAAVLYNSKFFIGTVGFLMHLSRSVSCKSIIIYGGREAPEQTGYVENINLYSKISCSPCWYWNKCTNNKECMKKVTVDDVINAAELISNH